MSWYSEYRREWKEIIETVARECKRAELMVEKDALQSMFLDSLAGTLETACLFFCYIAENSKKNIFAYPLDKIQNGGIMGSKEVSTLQSRVLKKLRRMRRMLLETPRRNSPPERRMRL